MATLTKEQIEDVRRLKHVFRNNLSIAKDYYDQLKNDAPEPTVNEELLKNLLKTGREEDKDDYYRHWAFNSMGKDEYDVVARGKKASETDLSLGKSLKLGTESGLLKIGQGLAETGAIGIDIASDFISEKTGTDIKTDTLGFIEENYPELEIDNFVGKSAELVTQYGTGYGLAKKGLEKVAAKRGKAYLKKRQQFKKDYPTISKISEIGVPAALSEPFVSTSRDETLLQAFGLYDAPITSGPEYDKLSSAEKAKVLLKQKALFGAEAIPTLGAIGVGIPKLAGPVARKAIQLGGLGSRAAGAVVDPIVRAATSDIVASAVSPVVRTAAAPFKKAKDLAAPVLNKIPPVKDWRLYSVKNQGKLGEQVLGGLNSTLSVLRTNAALTPDAMDSVRLAEQTINNLDRQIRSNMEIISDKVYQIAKEMTKKGEDGSSFAKQVLKEDLEKFFTNPLDAGNLLPTGTKIAAKRARELLKGVKKEYAKVRDDMFELKDKNVLDEAFTKDLDDYLNMTFKIQRGQLPSKEAIKDVTQLYKDRLKEIPSYKNKNIDAIAETRAQQLIQLGSKEGVNAQQLLTEASGFLAKDEGFLKKGEILPDAVRKLYGEVDDVRDRVLETVLELGGAVAKKRMNDSLVRDGLGKWLFRTADELAETKNISTALEQIKIPSRAGLQVADELNGLYTTPAIKQAIEVGGLATDAFIKSPILRGLMQFKGAAQVSKTVLSPTTQIRNVTSAAMFALANGHFGKGASLNDSIKYVVKDLFIKDGKFDTDLLQRKMAEYTEEGVINSSLMQREIELLAKDIAKGASLSKITTTDKLFETLYNSPVMKRLTKVYQAGDDIWKVYGYEFEKSRLTPILKTIDDVTKYSEEVLGKRLDNVGIGIKTGKAGSESADALQLAIRRVAGNVVKNTYPNYNYVPTLVQNIRRLPIGNFVSFPAEMVRTSGNIIKFGLKELNSSNSQIRAIGAKRLLGFGTAVLGTDRALQEVGQTLTEITNDQIEKLQRSYAPSWNMNGPLMPLSQEGLSYRYVNTGYQNPYTTIIQGPFFTAMNSINNRQLSGAELDEAMLKGMFDGAQVLLEPFTSESIAFESMLDIYARGGKTRSGKTVYYDDDIFTDKFTKTFSHVVVESLKPGAVVQANKFAMALANKFTKEGKDMYYSTQGKPYDLSDEAAALFAGVRIYEVDIGDSFKKYEVSGFIKRIAESRKQLASGKGGIYDYNNERDDIEEAFYQYQLRNYKIFSGFNIILNDAKALGMSEGEIIKAMTGRQGLTKRDISALINNQFNAANIPSVKKGSRFQQMREEKGMDNVYDLVPVGQMNKIRAGFMRIPLGLTDEEVRDFIYGRRQERYEEKIQRQQSSAVTPEIPITQPQMVTAQAPVASPTAVAGQNPVDTRQRIIQNDEFLKDLA